MCGIAGRVSWRGRIQEGSVERMLDSMAHRGPDGSGIWSSGDGSVVLGNRRLAILDLSDHGSQPMTSACGQFHIVYNGEVYNYKEIRQTHDKRGITYRGGSDTEVVLNHYSLFGETALKDFDGMFSMAVWDNATRELFCARDRFGEKPFYYHLDANREFTFASEIKALVAGGIQAGVNHSMLYSYFRNPAEPHVIGDLEATFYDRFSSMQSATCMRIGRGKVVSRKKYWNLDASHQAIADVSLGEASERFRELFHESIRRRLRSDVLVGSSLSGGIDSSSIVCSIPNLRERSAGPLHTFSARFRDFPGDEGRFIDDVNRESGSIGHSVYPSEADLAGCLERFAYFQDEPVESASAFAQWRVMQLAREAGVTVLIDGHGADELAAGYHEYFQPYLAELSASDPAVAAAARRDIIERTGHDPIAVDQIFPSRPGAVQRSMLVAKDAARRRLARTWLAAEGRGGGTFLTRQYMWEHGADRNIHAVEPSATLNESLKRALTHGRLANYLRYADRNSMAHSREIRLPFLSHILAEFMMSLPAQFKINSGWTKYVIRQAMNGIVPNSVLSRTDKIGFSVPQSRWMSSPEIADMAADAKAFLVREGIVNSKWIDRGEKNWEMLMSYHLVARIQRAA